MAKARCNPLWQPIPCPLSDIEGLESWLGDMAAQGLVPVTIGQNFARFRCSQPKAVRYRLNAKPAPETFLESAPGTPGGEERALAQDCGMTEEQVLTGLTVFGQVALVSFKLDPYQLTLLPMHKVALTDSPLRKYLITHYAAETQM